MLYDPDIELTGIGTKNRKLLFYPSCGTNCRWLFDYDCDVFVMADYYPRTKDTRRLFWKKFSRNMRDEISLVASTVRTRVFRFRNKLGFLFFQDNNEVFERIKNSGNKISCFIGVCDGCLEGGNYECVNDVKFLYKVISLIHPDGMTYVTDHSKKIFRRAKLYECSSPKIHEECILGDKLIRWIGSEGGYGPIAEYSISMVCSDELL